MAAKQEKISVWFTNADANYDYGYTKTVGETTDKFGKIWRVIHVSDASRFENFQRPRYGSGLRQAHADGSSEAVALGLQAPQPVKFECVGVSTEAYEYATESYMGWCPHCKDFCRDSTEPDAENYDCEVCEKSDVCGAEQALLLGRIDIEC